VRTATRARGGVNLIEDSACKERGRGRKKNE
jgi:hypothetical protein